MKIWKPLAIAALLSFTVVACQPSSAIRKAPNWGYDKKTMTGYAYCQKLESGFSNNSKWFIGPAGLATAAGVAIGLVPGSYAQKTNPLETSEKVFVFVAPFVAALTGWAAKILWERSSSSSKAAAEVTRAQNLSPDEAGKRCIEVMAIYHAERGDMANAALANEDLPKAPKSCTVDTDCDGDATCVSKVCTPPK